MFTPTLRSITGKPALVHGLEGHRISRVACGSSHSVCWTTPETPITSCHEPVLFTAAKDPLGAGFVTGSSNNAGRGIEIGPSDAHLIDAQRSILVDSSSTAIFDVTSSAGGPNTHLRKPSFTTSKSSLSRIILSLDSNVSKQVSEYQISCSDILCRYDICAQIIFKLNLICTYLTSYIIFMFSF